MDTLYYDAIKLIFDRLDLQDLANLLNCNNKYLYETLMKYIKQKKIYKDIIRYDVERYKIFGKIYYTDFLQYGSKFKKLVDEGMTRLSKATLFVFPETLEVIRHILMLHYLIYRSCKIFINFSIPKPISSF